MNKWLMLEKISFTIILLFAFFGFLMLGNIVHEYSHVQDYKEVSRGGNICFLNIQHNVTMREFMSKSAIAYYKFSLEEGKLEEAKAITKYTERKAMALEMIPVAIFILSFTVVIFTIIRKWRYDNEEYEQERYYQTQKI